MMEHYAGSHASLHGTIRREVGKPASIDDNVPGCPPRPGGYVRGQPRNPGDRRGASRWCHGPAMGARCLQCRLCSPVADRRASGRSLRPAAAVSVRHCRLHRRVAAMRRGAERCRVDRGARRRRRGSSIAAARLALDHPRCVGRRESPQSCPRRLGCLQWACVRGWPYGRRRAGRLIQLAQCLPCCCSVGPGNVRLRPAGCCGIQGPCRPAVRCARSDLGCSHTRRRSARRHRGRA
jgi:hypothetical protein